MSLTTSLRFEQIPSGGNSRFKQAFQDQVDRINYDELMADRENVGKLEKNASLRAKWNENLEEASWKKRVRNDNECIKGELRMAAKASIAVRRVALKQLLEREFEMYEKELSAGGKTFYKQRV